MTSRQRRQHLMARLLLEKMKGVSPQRLADLDRRETILTEALAEDRRSVTRARNQRYRESRRAT